ncbi:MAG TPA: hypothetical protein VKN16_13590 [Methylomirabilota bacterium]|jgi:hypothetical protein|nr:hypothetical protein [Methylomirabilota bacterium]
MLARLGGAALLAGLLVIPAVSLAADADEGQTLDIRRLSPDQRRRLLAGETVIYAVPETTDVQLGAGVAMYLPVALARVAEMLTSPDLVLRDSSITASGPIPADATPLALRGFTLGGGEIGEAQEVLEASPGPRFNLSTAEIEAFHAARARVRPGDRGSVLEAAASQWRVVLLQRAQAFRARGLEGVAPYARRGGSADPAALLRAAADDARIATSVAPRLGAELLVFPADQSPTATSHFYWVRRQVQSRPDPIVIHHLTDVTGARALYVERQIYVGHTYDASQILCVAVPYEDGVVILSSNRVATEQVTGLGADMKKLIGRRQLRGEILKRFDRIRAAFVRPAPPVRVESP